MKKSRAAKATAFTTTTAVGWENIRWSPLESAWIGSDMSLEENPMSLNANVRTETRANRAAINLGTGSKRYLTRASWILSLNP
jgi:hypothetical protein